jgi:DNA mismatch endonuclease (patch repair protein)
MSSDALSPKARSTLMSKVRGKGNRSTELKVAATLARNRIKGWKKHPEDIEGRPDFYFRELRLAIFVDGCFWHGCPYCRRNIPKTRRAFWKAKIEGNKKRDRRINRKLRSAGFHVMRIWEHDITNGKWFKRFRAMAERIGNARNTNGL